MLSWNFPDELICCVCLHHKGVSLLADEQLKNTCAAAVAVSSLIPDPLRQEADGLEQLIELDRSWDALELLPLAERIDAEFQDIAGESNNQFPFFRICQNALERSKKQT